MQLLANTSFEQPFSATTTTQWVNTSTAGATALQTPGDVISVPKAHTGDFFARLMAPPATTAQITQTVPVLLPPGSNLKLSFFTRRTLDITTTVTATLDLTLFGIIPSPGFATISIPPRANPVPNSSGVFEYYEVFSPPLPFGVTSAAVTISVAGAGAAPAFATWDFDDVTLYNDII